MQTFEYPLRQEVFQQISSKSELKTLLHEEAVFLHISRQYFKLTIQFGRYIYAKCRKCQANLKYKKEGDIFQLKNFGFLHNHDQR
jgi:hypothetical protein